MKKQMTKDIYEKAFNDMANDVEKLRPEAQAIAQSRGHGIYCVDDVWRYADTGEPFDELRPCKRCGREPTLEGYDACMGHISGAKSVCCGHGLEKPYVIYESDSGGEHE